MNPNIRNIIDAYNEFGCFIPYDGDIYWYNGKRLEFFFCGPSYTGYIRNIEQLSSGLLLVGNGREYIYKNKHWEQKIVTQNSLRFKFGKISITITKESAIVFVNLWLKDDISHELNPYDRRFGNFCQVDNYFYFTDWSSKTLGRYSLITRNVNILDFNIDFIFAFKNCLYIISKNTLSSFENNNRWIFK